MSVKYTSTTAQVDKQISIKSSIFLRTFADAVVAESTPNTPKEKGNLRNDVIRQVLGLKGKVVWGKNYAGIQETKQFKNYTTPGTGPHFARNAVENVTKRTNAIAKSVGLI
jgi:hypothetical protein